MCKPSYLYNIAFLAITSGAIMTGGVLAHDNKASPQSLYGALFAAVQAKKLFADSKTFADAIATKPVDKIMKDYEQQAKERDFDLKQFIMQHFRFEAATGSGYKSGHEDICTHIRNLWPILTRKPVAENTASIVGSSLLPLHYPYVVPGGRFREIYYWDSYFTMLGLRDSGEIKLMRFMVQNFADLIKRYGHVPNGNRSYYLSRSQPPFFSLMVDLLAEAEGNQVYTEFLPALQQEYAFWMEGEKALSPGQSDRRVVRMGDGAVLNRYYSDSAVPRDESWREDMATAATADRKPIVVYRNLRAAAESGWDFSSRWLKNPQKLSTIRTLDMVPIDLNSLIYHLEQVLAKAYQLGKDPQKVKYFQGRAAERKRALNDYLWNNKTGFYADYILSERRLADGVSAATLYPLFFMLADDQQAQRVAQAVQKDLVKTGGLITTPIETGQQWDAPNVWAPLQWIAVKALLNYHQDGLALEIARHWTDNVWQVYQQIGALKEKYRGYQISQNAGGGEYPNQDGFGWTNGVMLAMLHVFPQLPAAKSCFAK